jgi:hypothetical protein
MPIVDANGRLFGRLNLIDALVLVLVVGMIPLAYGAYGLFRTPAPQLVAVEPNTLVSGPNLRVSIRGEHLRPYMRVSFNDTQGNSFIFRNTSEALVDLNPMPPGVYDVVLYDNAQERARLPQAFTLKPTPLPASHIILVGTFGNLTNEGAAGITKGMTIPGVGEIIDVSAPLPEATRVYAGPVIEIPIERAVRVPVALRVGCAVRAPQGVPQCALGDAPLQPMALVVMNTPVGALPFQVDQLRGSQPLETVEVVVQFPNRRELLAQIRPGDTDRGQYANPLAAGATVAAVGRPVALGGDTERVDVTLRAEAQRTSTSWSYASLPLRVGSSFVLRTPEYELQGTVVRISPEWTSPSEDSSSTTRP